MGFEKIQSQRPAVITVTKSINNPRNPSVKGKMASKKAIIKVLTAMDLGLDENKIGEKGSATEVAETFAPKKKAKGVLINEGSGKESAEVLMEKLISAGLVLEKGGILYDQ